MISALITRRNMPGESSEHVSCVMLESNIHGGGTGGRGRDHNPERDAPVDSRYGFLVILTMN